VTPGSDLFFPIRVGFADKSAIAALSCDRALLCVDGVHGFGAESASMKDLGADFFAAGCHRWLFGPPDTGILWGRKDAWTSGHHSKLH
jgi:selenocysteine lyase/cysteine desulfurase